MTTHTTATWLAPVALLALLAGCGSQEPGQAPASQAAPVAALEAEGMAFAPATLPPLDPGAVARCSIDKVDGQPRGEAPHAAGGSVVVEGWVADAGLEVPAGFSVVLAGAGTWAVRGESTVLREDVASALGSPGLAMSGFGVSASLAGVPAGEYALDLLVAHGDGRHSLCATGVRLRVGAAG